MGELGARVGEKGEIHTYMARILKILLGNLKLEREKHTLHTVTFDTRVRYRGNYPWNPHPRNFEPPLKFQHTRLVWWIEIAHGKVVPGVRNRVTIPHGFVRTIVCEDISHGRHGLMSGRAIRSGGSSLYRWDYTHVSGKCAITRDLTACS